MKKIILLVLICIGFYQTQAQDYIYLSEDGIQRFMRFDIGYTNFSMTPKDSATKTANGIHLSDEAKILSGFIDNDYFTVHDAFYFNMDMGIMGGTKQTYRTETESGFALSTSFGYLGMIGYRNKKWGALVGVDFKWRTSFIGGVSMPNLDGDLLYFSRPFVIRGEYNLSKENSRRLIGTFWHDGGNNTTRAPYQSVRVELGLGESERWWLLLQYNHQKALGENHFMINPPAEVSFNQFIVGLRIGLLP